MHWKMKSTRGIFKHDSVEYFNFFNEHTMVITLLKSHGTFVETDYSLTHKQKPQFESNRVTDGSLFYVQILLSHSRTLLDMLVVMMHMEF
jgi:hypothetical protein